MGFSFVLNVHHRKHDPSAHSGILTTRDTPPRHNVPHPEPPREWLAHKRLWLLGTALVFAISRLIAARAAGPAYGPSFENGVLDMLSRFLSSTSNLNSGAQKPTSPATRVCC